MFPAPNQTKDKPKDKQMKRNTFAVLIATFLGAGAFLTAQEPPQMPPPAKEHEWLQQFVGNWDLFYGVFKSIFFGATIALVSCYRGFHCAPGAEGVGRAATAAFVLSFVIIIMLDFFLSIGLDSLYDLIWPETLA